MEITNVGQLYNIESRFTQMQEERVKVLVELSRTTFQVCRHKGCTCFPVNFLFKNENVVDVCHFVPLRIYLCLLFFAISIFIVDFRVRQNLDKILLWLILILGKHTHVQRNQMQFLHCGYRYQNFNSFFLHLCKSALDIIEPGISSQESWNKSWK